MVGHQRQHDAGHRGKLQGLVDVRPCEFAREGVQPILGREEQQHRHCDDHRRAALPEKHQTAQQVGHEPDRPCGEPDVAVAAGPTHEEQRKEGDHAGESGEEEPRVLLAGEPSAQGAYAGPQGEGARTGHAVCRRVAALLAPLALETEQGAERGAHQQGFEQLGHTVILAPRRWRARTLPPRPGRSQPALFPSSATNSPMRCMAVLIWSSAVA